MRDNRDRSEPREASRDNSDKVGHETETRKQTKKRNATSMTEEGTTNKKTNREKNQDPLDQGKNTREKKAIGTRQTT